MKTSYEDITEYLANLSKAELETFNEVLALTLKNKEKENATKRLNEILVEIKSLFQEGKEISETFDIPFDVGTIRDELPDPDFNESDEWYPSSDDC